MQGIKGETFLLLHRNDLRSLVFKSFSTGLEWKRGAGSEPELTHGGSAHTSESNGK